MSDTPRSPTNGSTMTSDSPDSIIAPDGCPRCGGHMVPVLDGRTEGPGPLLADPPVRLVCPPCSDGSSDN